MMLLINNLGQNRLGSTGSSPLVSGVLPETVEPSRLALLREDTLLQMTVDLLKTTLDLLQLILDLLRGTLDEIRLDARASCLKTLPQQL